MSDPGARWDRAMKAAIERDHEAVIKEYPYLARRISTTPYDIEVGDWLMSIGLNQIVLEKSTRDWITDTVIVTHAFRYEADALAFKLRFPCE